MKVLVYGNRYKDGNRKYVQALFNKLAKEKVQLFVYHKFDSEIQGHIKIPQDFTIITTYEELQEHRPDCILTLGGDGTILTAVTLIRDLRIPILGINLGRLGFLASIEKTKLEAAIDKLLSGQYTIDERKMLYLESNMPLFGETRFALNDFTIHKRDTSSMIVIHTYINGDFLNSYWADGIIVSTPTGSTGYSLSCGGPIIFPNSDTFVITPVAPHNLTVRPIVIADDNVISCEIEGRTGNYLCTLDSRYETITTAHQLAVRKCDFESRLINLHDITFLKTIHDKLSWGIDTRNE